MTGMSDLAIGIVGITVGLGLIALRMPIGASFGIVSFIGIAAILNMKAAWGIITAVPYSFVGDWNLSAVPMFLFMGFVASNTGLSKGLVRACRMFLVRLPGGLAVASVGACALFAAASGSSLATASAMSRITTPEMLRYRYDPGLASAVVAASGTLGSLIPPSILMVLYGYFAGASIGKLFIAGIVPGILTALLYAAMIMGRVAMKPSLAPPMSEMPSRADKIAAIRDIWPLPVLIGGVLSGIFLGVFTPTEAGASGAFLAIAIAGVRGSMTRQRFMRSVVQTLSSTSSVFMVVIGTVLLTRFMAISGVPTALTELLLLKDASPLYIVLIASIVFLILGMFVDSIGLLLLTLPILLPLVEAAGMDLIWFGIIVIKLLEIGLVTPPVGLNVYVIKGALGDLVPLKKIFGGVMWFLAMDVIVLFLVVAFPRLSLWLPSLME